MANGPDDGHYNEAGIVAMTLAAVTAPGRGAGNIVTTSWTLSVTAIREICIAAYFCLGWLYYLKAAPFGHLTNLLFLAVFSCLAVGTGGLARLGRKYLPFVAVISITFVACVIGAVVRAETIAIDLLTATTWLLPVALLVVLAQDPCIRHGLVCRTVCVVNLVLNIVITAGFATFNSNLGKFELATSWIDVSSNELSFHMTVFGVLFLVAAQYPRLRLSGYVLAISSLLHLSKAHIGVALIAAGAAAFRRRLRLAVVAVLAAIGGLRFLITSDAISTFAVPDSMAMVFGRLRDMLEISGLALFGQIVASDRVANAVGGARFFVYTAAAAAVSTAPFGVEQGQLQRVLLGLDPHSNILYLALREGWGVAIGYVVACFLLLQRLSSQTLAARVILAGMVYMFLRSALLTYDPVKIVAIMVYLSWVVSNTPSIRAKDQ